MGIIGKSYKDFEAHCQEIERMTPVDKDEPASERKARIEKAKRNYQFFFEYYFPQYATAKCAKYHIELAQAVKASKTFKGIIEWYRGSAKSVHATVGIPMWLKIQGELKVMLLVGQTADKANRLLADIQAQLMSNHRYKHDYGAQFSFGNWSDGEFKTKDGCGFFAIGLGQNPRGTRVEQYRPDYILCDDTDSKARCKNPVLVREAIEWIEDDLMGCFDIGRERFILCNNRISKTSILAGMVEKKVTTAKHPYYYSKVNAIDSKGNPTWPEKYTRQYWKEKREEKTLRSWEQEYMNNPIEEGSVFRYEWIKWITPLPWNHYDQLIAYCDPSFKNTSTSDYKAIKVWGKRGTELHLLKCFVRQSSVSTMVKWFYDLHESLPNNVICDYYMEANFLQDLLLDEFYDEGNQRGYQLPIRADKRAKPDKFSRIEATSPLYERGYIFYNSELKDDPDMQKGLEQLLAIEQGSKTPDDSPDADEGALFMLQKRGRVRNYVPRIGARTHKNEW